MTVKTDPTKLPFVRNLAKGHATAIGDLLDGRMGRKERELGDALDAEQGLASITVALGLALADYIEANTDPVEGADFAQVLEYRLALAAASAALVETKLRSATKAQELADMTTSQREYHSCLLVSQGDAPSPHLRGVIVTMGILDADEDKLTPLGEAILARGKPDRETPSLIDPVELQARMEAYLASKQSGLEAVGASIVESLKELFGGNVTVVGPGIKPDEPVVH